MTPPLLKKILKVAIMELNLSEKLESAIKSNNYQEAVLVIREFVTNSDLPSNEQGIQIGKALLELHNNFYVLPIHYIYKNISNVLEADIKISLDNVLKKHIDTTVEWHIKLRSLSRERYGRTVCDYIRAGKDSQAFDAILKMFSPSNEEANKTTANFLGTILGRMINDLPIVDKLIKHLSSYVGKNGITKDIISIVFAAKEAKIKAIYKTGLEVGETELTREIIQLTVQLANCLPIKRSTSKLTDEDYDKFRLPVMAIFKAVISEKRENLLYDAIELLKEFTPKEHSATSKLAHIEQRLYNTLAPRQRRVVMSVFEDVGRNRKVSDLVLSYAERNKYNTIAESTVQVMGMMRNPSFVPFIVKLLDDKKTQVSYNYLIMALGTIADVSSVNTLLNELKKVFKKRYVDPEKKDIGIKILNSMGRVFLLNPKMDYALRNDIIKKVLSVSPDDTEVNVAIGGNLFIYSPRDISAELMQEGVNRLIRALWSQDPRATWSSILDEEDKPVKFRQKTVDALLKIKDAAGIYIQEALESYLGRPCGAYISIAEILGEIKSERFITILEKMLLETLAIDKLAPTTYGVEKIWDEKHGVERYLTVEDIETEIVDALGKIGTEKAYGVLARFHKQVQKGEVKSISERTAKVLFDVQKKGLLKEEEPKIIDKEKALAVVDESIYRLPINELIKMAKGPLIFSSKNIPERVTAIEALGAKAKPEAILPLIKILNEKNIIIRTAVIDALKQYSKKGVNKYIRDEAFNELIQNLDVRNEDVCSGILEVFRKIGLNNEILLNKIKQAQSIGSEKIKKELSKLFRKISENGKVEYIGIGEVASGKLDEKREYYLAYQKWVREGKQGSPPVKPKDLD